MAWHWKEQSLLVLCFAEKPLVEHASDPLHAVSIIPLKSSKDRELVTAVSAALSEAAVCVAVDTS